MTATPKSLRLHIAFFGRRNVGKSSLLNALTRQQVSIVSPVAGTTTDPVEKPMELLPLGPVLFIDTAGIDDAGELGALRVQKTRQVLERTDLAVLVAEAGAWGNFEEDILRELLTRKTPAVVVFNKTDAAQPDATLVAKLAEQKTPVLKTSATTRHRNLGIAPGAARCRAAGFHRQPGNSRRPRRPGRNGRARGAD